MDIFFQKTLYRILRGRLRFRRDDLVLFIKEPSQELLYDSFEIYDEAYQHAYFRGVYVKDEIKQVLMEQRLWSPFDDREGDDLETQIEDLKVMAFRSFYRKKELVGIKRYIKTIEKKLAVARSKKHILDHVSCDGVGNYTRWNWIISKSVFYEDGEPYDWKDLSIAHLVKHYEDNVISSETYRKIARNDPWRSMWANGKKQSDVFGRPAVELTKDQLALCSYSGMYDSAYESHESPDEKIIDDDDCLDGWFIVQRRKYDRDKKEREVDDLIKNPKIAASQEIYLMAGSQEEADNITGLNSAYGKNVIQSRDAVLHTEGSVKHVDMPDMKIAKHVAANRAGMDTIKGK
tara:strand:- start:76 stop:1116 length:1041 start_codon:yes stop_codon:yes gene_type:complete